VIKYVSECVCVCLCEARGRIEKKAETIRQSKESHTKQFLTVASAIARLRRS
jgi:hypothetical protein